MRIVQINSTYGSGDSTGRTTKEFHQWLHQQGHSSYVFAARINDNVMELSKQGIFSISSETDGKIHAFFSRLTGLQGYYSSKSTRKMLKKLKSINPQVVILRVLHSNCINLPMLFRYLSINNIAVILVLHDCWYFTGHCCHYTEVRCQKWKGECKNCPQIHQWNNSWLFDTAKKCLRDKQRWFSSISNLAVVGVSDWITEEAKQSILGVNDAIFKRIYNWIDLSTFHWQDAQKLRKELGIQAEKQILLGIAVNWNSRKGLKEILFIAEKLPMIKIILIGKTASGIKFPKNILCIGTINDPALIVKYYTIADIFLNPSIQETFGKTTAEALCCGTPVVAYKTTACIELVNQGCGEIVPLGNKKLYLKAVKNILAEGKEKYSLNCIKFAQRNFNPDINMLAYISLMQELLKK